MVRREGLFNLKREDFELQARTVYEPTQSAPVSLILGDSLELDTWHSNFRGRNFSNLTAHGS